MPTDPEARVPPAREGLEREVVQIIADLALELHPGRPLRTVHSLDGDLDRDFGLDSLGRSELLMRLERTYNIQLPDGLIESAHTPRDLANALSSAGGAARPRGVVPRHAMILGESQSLPAGVETLPAILDWHAAHNPDRPHLILSDGEDEEPAITFQQLHSAAHARAQALRQLDLEPNDRIALMLPTSRAFFEVFMGALYIGAVPVPVYPPTRLDQLEEHLRRLAGILGNSEARVLVTVPEARSFAPLVLSLVPSLKAVVTPGELMANDREAVTVSGRADDLALIQYTSGSTGDPKGVILTHRNILANIRAAGEAVGASSKDVFVSWLPVYHDLGLIGAWLACLCFAAPSVIMSPLQFLARPKRWLWTMHRARATLSAAPNFAFELCAEQLSDADLDGLDLSTLRAVISGSEPVSPATIRRFTGRFKRYGLRPEAVMPAYGLAECAVALTLPPRGRPPRIDRIKSEAFARWRQAVPAAEDDSAAVELVSCGLPLPRHEVRIIDEAGREAPERREGRLQFRGPSATSGYFHNPEKTRALFDGSWLDSGDLAYVAAGEVFITGRTKDIIIHGGRHIHPSEIETALARLNGVEKRGAVLLGIPEPRIGTERLVAVVETNLGVPAERDALKATVANHVMEMTGVSPDDVVLTPPRSIPRTASGKVRRLAARESYLAGHGMGVYRSRLWQIMRLVAAAIAPGIRRAGAMIGAWLYAGYWWAVLCLFGAVVWPLVVFLPRLSWRWKVLHRAARWMLRLQGIPLATELTSAPPLRDAIIAVNHSSYFDGVPLLAALPGEPVIAVAREFASHPFIGPFLRGLNVLFVERFEPRAGIEDTARAAALAGRGALLVFFPEATYTRLPGLAEFRLGAFRVAAETGRPVIPVVIRGTRSVLRGGHWFPRKGPISIWAGAPIRAKGQGFQAAVALRDEVRCTMLARTGEPDLAPVA